LVAVALDISDATGVNCFALLEMKKKRVDSPAVIP
jgi:hypothetical protein